MKFWNVALRPLVQIVVFCVTIPAFRASISAEKKAIEPWDAFRMVQNVLCKDYEKESCTYESFEIKEVDLNGDGQSEWMYFGPSGECGAYGNCPFMIFMISRTRWKLLYSDWGNSYGSRILTSRHRGYRDLEIADAPMNRFSRTKEKLIWNGTGYVIVPNSTTYYLHDGERLVQVSKTRWDQCTSEGQNCL